MKKEIIEALINQINAEMYSAFLYLSMAIYFNDENYNGFENWMQKQYEEEMSHAFRIIKYLQDRGQKPELLAIDRPIQEWSSKMEIFETILNHEKKVSGMIRDIMDLAVSQKDYETISMLQWFIDEQVEEEDQSSALLERFKKANHAESAIMLLDAECGKRKD